jgi:K+-sensing histidine kinase KdpD
MENIMVCVTKQRTCQRLIDYGKNFIKDDRDTMHIIHVADKDYNFLGDSEENRALEFLYEKAREAGAELTVLKSDDVIGTLAGLVKDNEVTKVIVGASGDKTDDSGFISKLRLLIGESADLIVLASDK